MPGGNEFSRVNIGSFYHPDEEILRKFSNPSSSLDLVGSQGSQRSQEDKVSVEVSGM